MNSPLNFIYYCRNVRKLQSITDRASRFTFANSRNRNGRNYNQFRPLSIRYVALKSRRARFGNRVILLAGAAGDADGTDDFAVFFQRNAARENHYFAVV